MARNFVLSFPDVKHISNRKKKRNLWLIQYVTEIIVYLSIVITKIRRVVILIITFKVKRPSSRACFEQKCSILLVNYLCAVIKKVLLIITNNTLPSFFCRFHYCLENFRKSCSATQ